MPTFRVTREDLTTYDVDVPATLIRRFETLCRQMRTCLVEIQKHAPEAGLYLEESGPLLMIGPTHGGARPSPLQQNVIAHGGDWPHSGGGGW